jgi:mono/diheme cytochrome c family protein
VDAGIRHGAHNLADRTAFCGVAVSGSVRALPGDPSVHVRAISTACLFLCLGAFGACDDPKDAKVEAKTKADEKKADPDEKKADEAKADEKKADEAKADEAKADEAKADEAKADEAKADAKADDAKADETKADAKVEPKKTEPKKVEPKETKPDTTAKIDAKSIYEKKCKTCHGPTGKADTKVGKENDIPDWTVAGWKGKWTEAKVIDIVKNGKSGTKMKPFKDKLTADEIVAVSKYSRSLGK